MFTEYYLRKRNTSQSRKLLLGIANQTRSLVEDETPKEFWRQLKSRMYILYNVGRRTFIIDIHDRNHQQNGEKKL